MNEVKFKVGDLVYCPTLSNEILTVTGNNTFWFKSSIGDKMWTSFTDTGKLKAIYNNPSIFPATQEWYDKLVHIYPNLEKPPIKKEPKEIIKAMLNSGWKYVACRVCDTNDKTFDYIGLIYCIDDSSSYRFIGDSQWKYAIPFDPKTGKTIIDFVDGEVVLED